MRNRMYFGDLLVTREIKALDSAWEEFVGKLYLMTFNAASDMMDVEKRSDYMLETIDEIERARVLYLEERTRLKGKFSKKEEEESEVEDGEAFRVASGENGDVAKEDRGFIFNEHPEVKEKACDGLEEFLRRTLKEDE